MVVASLYDELIEYLAEKAPPEVVLAFEPSEEAQRRAEYLLQQNQAGELTPDEKLELKQLQQFDGVVSVLKARAARALRQA